MPGPGYHVGLIHPGTFGKPSKIMEEANEFQDAINQGCHVMALVELSDLVGAIEGYLAKKHPSIKLDDLIVMSRITQRAFTNGHRIPK